MFEKPIELEDECQGLDRFLSALGGQEPGKDLVAGTRPEQQTERNPEALQESVVQDDSAAGSATPVSAGAGKRKRQQTGASKSPSEAGAQSDTEPVVPSTPGVGDSILADSGYAGGSEAGGPGPAEGVWWTAVSLPAHKNRLGSQTRA